MKEQQRHLRQESRELAKQLKTTQRKVARVKRKCNGLSVEDLRAMLLSRTSEGAAADGSGEASGSGAASAVTTGTASGAATDR
jgi:hypothetical protein